MTSVLLINPPVTLFEGSMAFGTYVPIGLLSLAANVREYCEVEIFDCLLEDAERRETEECVQYGTPWEIVEQRIRDASPDIIGISTPFSAQADNAKEICKIAKQAAPNAIIVFGGPHATVKTKGLLEETEADFCVIGEGEEIFLDFIQSYNAGTGFDDISGLVYRGEDGTIHFSPPRTFLNELDKLPLPAYDLIDMEAYLSNDMLYKNRSDLNRSISVITSRGCPYKCVFCSISSHMGKKFRTHTVDYVMRHLHLLIERYGIRTFHFEDDNVSLDVDRFEGILDRIIAEDLQIKWDLPNGIRADTLNKSLLEKMKKAGCIQMNIAIESGNQEVLDKVIKKACSLEHIIEIAKFSREVRLKTSAFFVIGFPGETMDDMKETVALAASLQKKYKVTPILLTAAPLYGTELYKVCKENGFLKKNMSDRDFAIATQAGGSSLITTNDFTSEDVQHLAQHFMFQRSPFRHKVSLAMRIILNPISMSKKIKSRLVFLYKSASLQSS